MTRVPAAGKLRTFADIKKNDPIRVAFLDNNEKVVGCKPAIAALNATAGPGVDDSALCGEIDAVKKRLAGLELALQYRVLKMKRQKVWEDGQRELKTLPLPELRARVIIRDWKGMSLEDLVRGYAVPPDLAAMKSTRGFRARLLSAE